MAELTDSITDILLSGSTAQKLEPTDIAGAMLRAQSGRSSYGEELNRIKAHKINESQNLMKTMTWLVESRAKEDERKRLAEKERREGWDSIAEFGRKLISEHEAGDGPIAAENVKLFTQEVDKKFSPSGQPPTKTEFLSFFNEAAPRYGFAVKDPIKIKKREMTAQKEIEAQFPEFVTGTPGAGIINKRTGEQSGTVTGKEDKKTPAMLNAEALGLKPGDEDYKEYIRAATVERPGIKIDLGQQADVEKTRALMHVFQKQLEQMQIAGSQFSDLEPKLQTISQILESGKVETGPVEEVLVPLRQTIKDMGFSIDKNLPQAEQVRAAMSYLTPRMRVVGTGATSDFEMQEFSKAAPRFANTTEGNIILSRSFLQIQERNRKAYDLALRYFAKEGSLAGFGDHSDKTLGPVFPRPTTQEEFDAIRPGTVYFHPERGFTVRREVKK